MLKHYHQRYKVRMIFVSQSLATPSTVAYSVEHWFRGQQSRLPCCMPMMAIAAVGV